jgi:hypothetical protein
MMNNDFLVQESSGFTPRGKFHIASERGGAALCGAQPRMGPRWNVNGSRADFERGLSERICKRCRKAEAARA